MASPCCLHFVNGKIQVHQNHFQPQEQFHFYQKPVSSKKQCHQKQFHQNLISSKWTFSSETNFIKNHFSSNHFHSKTIFIQNEINQIKQKQNKMTHNWGGTNNTVCVSVKASPAHKKHTAYARLVGTCRAATNAPPSSWTLRAAPFAWSVLTMVVSMASWARPKSGNTSATTSNLRVSAALGSARQVANHDISRHPGHLLRDRCGRASSFRSTVWSGWTFLVHRISHHRGLWWLVTRGANTVKSTATSTGVGHSTLT